MKIQIIKPTVVNGENVKAGDEIDVKKSVANLLINSNKAISLEKTEVSLYLEISEDQLDAVKKELETEFEKTINELSSEIELYKKIIKEKDSLIAEQLNEIEKKSDLEKVLTEKDEVIEELKEDIENSKTEAQAEVAELRKELDEQDALIAKMEQDIKNLTLKELREKYPAVVVETE